MTTLLAINTPTTAANGAPEPATDAAATRGRVLALLNASWMTQAAAVAVRLRLPELLGAGPQPPAALAQATGCHQPSLLRLLRALSSLDLVAEHDDGSFALTAAGTLLRSDVDDSLAAWALLCGTSSWTTWSRLVDSVRTGESVRRLTGGIEGFAHLEADREAAHVFNRAMVDLTRPVADAVVRVVDFGKAHHVVDVGGGAGVLLATILAAHPTLQGTLFDLAHAHAMAGDLLAQAEVAERCRRVTGSFFESVPADADVYLLKSILHDWDDQRCAAILRTCRSAMKPGARLLVIERMMPERYGSTSIDQGIARSDLNMLVGPGGRERTQAEYRALIDASGLARTGVRAVTDSFSVIEAVAP